MTYIKKSKFFTLCNDEGRDIKYTRISPTCMERVEQDKYNYMIGLQVQHYDTIIIKIDYKKEAIVLNTNGRGLTTTKNHMNEQLARFQLHIQQRNFNWYVIKNNKIKLEYIDNMTIPFN